MLVSSLQVTGHSYLNPIFVSACGLNQAIANVFKAMKGKKYVYKLTIEDLEQPDEVKETTKSESPKNIQDDIM